ncbi:MAG: hypothetical protein HYS09_06375 [Chloroflexi bacterium]|nr:hypothetical protein [Chloroflexota bacterium]
MSRPAARPRPRRLQPAPEQPQRPRVSIPSLALVLPVIAFLIALGFQAALKAGGMESDHPLRVVLTPLVGAAVVFAGLRRYPTAGRVRLALMVAVALFVVALAT